MCAWNFFRNREVEKEQVGDEWDNDQPGARPLLLPSPTLMDVDVPPTAPSGIIENTDITTMVELLYEYTPRDLKGLLATDGASPCPLDSPPPFFNAY